MPRHPDINDLDYELMANKVSWPLTNLLPLKRVEEGTLAFGYLYKDSGYKVFKSTSDFDEHLLYASDYYEYKDLDSLIEDGWKVD